MKRLAKSVFLLSWVLLVVVVMWIAAGGLE